MAIGIIPLLLALVILIPVWVYRRRIGWQITTYLSVTLLLGAIGSGLWLLTRREMPDIGIWYATGMIVMTLAAIAVFLGVMEFGLLRLVGFFRLGAISRVTYYEGLLQPFTLIVLGTGMLAMGVCARLGYFTYNEDFKMYRDVAASFVFLFSLPVMVFASTKVIDEEIENRTMLTLMSKPVSRTQVVLGKYLGVLLLVVMAVGSLGIMAGMCSYLRYFDDMSIDYRISIGNAAEWARLDNDNYKAMMALLPSLVLTFFQVATLAAISVAVSTRFGLAVNVTTVAVIYIIANLARFVGNTQDLPIFFRGVATLLSYLLPGLTLLDLNQRLIFGNYTLGPKEWGPGLPSYTLIWQYVGLACVYSVFYIAAILCFGVALFRSRELS